MKTVLMLLVLLAALLVAGCPREPRVPYDDRLNKPPPWSKNVAKAVAERAANN